MIYSYFDVVVIIIAGKDMRQMLVKTEEENGTPTETENCGRADSGCCGLRGIQWRIKLGVLPSMKSSIDELRRAAADGRRKYADMRRRFLVDPHIMEEGQKGAQLNMDNPLSQDPESIWGRFFRNAELERSIDKDLTRLYPEHGSYFQTPACQAMLRRILLVWSLTHSEHSYRQGMHELLAPLLYVLHVDVTHLSHVKHLFEDLSDDRFDVMLFQENNLSSIEILEKQRNMSPVGKKVLQVAEEDQRLNDSSAVEILKCQANMEKCSSADELDPEVRAIFLGSDAYGAEGELGALLSGRFIEHDAYCMFDVLLSGQDGAVGMADYFMNYPGVSSASGLPPVIETSAALYKLLAVTDISLYSHLVELCVEPQFFALRWLRVLFGREFVLQDLLLVWDAIFSASNSCLCSSENDSPANNIVNSPRSAFILAMAVSMLLHLRSTLLATTNATTCLQRLLNFPRSADVRKLIENAASLQSFALGAASATSPPLKKVGCTLDYGSVGKLSRSASGCSPFQVPSISHISSVLQYPISSPCSPDRWRALLPESYWEEKWRTSMLKKMVHKESLGQEGMDANNSLGRTNGTISTGQQDAILDSDGCMEPQRSGEQGCPTESKHESEPISNNTDDNCENGNFVKAAAKCKLLDDSVKSSDLQIKSTNNKLFTVNKSRINNSSAKKVLRSAKQNMEALIKRQNLDGYCVQPNGNDLYGLEGAQHNSECKVSESQVMDPSKCNDSVDCLCSKIVIEQKAKSLSELSNDRMKWQESNKPVSASHRAPVIKLEDDRITACDNTDFSKTVIEVGQKLLIQSEDKTNGMHPTNHHQYSDDSTSKGSVAKAVTGHSSQTGGISAFWKKQKPSSGVHPAKLRWIWNLGRIIHVAKASGELHKDESSENDSICDGKERLFEENNVSVEAKAKNGLPEDELSENNSVSDSNKRLVEENDVSPKAKGKDGLPETELSANNIDLYSKRKSCEQMNTSPGTDCSDEPPKDGMSTDNADSGDLNRLTEENNVPLGANAEDELPMDVLLANEFDLDGKGKVSSENVRCPTSNVVDSSISSRLVIHKEGEGTLCNTNVQDANLVNDLVSEASFLTTELSSVPKDENPSVTLRIIGQSMLDNIQVLEAAFLEGSTMLNRDITLSKSVEHSLKTIPQANGHMAALTALAELRKIGSKLLQM